MRKAFAKALATGFDGYIWFNDDTLLEEDALHRTHRMCNKYRRLVRIRNRGRKHPRSPHWGMDLWRSPKKGIMVSVGFYSLSCQMTAGQFLRHDEWKLHFCPWCSRDRLGNLDHAFQHQLGDFDYGLRATKAGIPIFIAPGYFGYIAPQSIVWHMEGLEMPFRKRWRHLMSPEGRTSEGVVPLYK